MGGGIGVALARNILTSVAATIRLDQPTITPEPPVRQCNLYEAKTQLSQLVQAAVDGEEIIIARAGKPAVRLVPVDASGQRSRGWGMLKVDRAAIDAGFRPSVEKQVADLVSGRKR